MNQAHVCWEIIDQADTTRQRVMTDQSFIKYVETKVSPSLQNVSLNYTYTECFPQSNHILSHREVPTENQKLIGSSYGLKVSPKFIQGWDVKCYQALGLIPSINSDSACL